MAERPDLESVIQFVEGKAVEYEQKAHDARLVADEMESWARSYRHNLGHLKALQKMVAEKAKTEPPKPSGHERCESRLMINTEDGPGTMGCSLLPGHDGRHRNIPNHMDWSNGGG